MLLVYNISLSLCRPISIRDDFWCMWSKMVYKITLCKTICMDWTNHFEWRKVKKETKRCGKMWFTTSQNDMFFIESDIRTAVAAAAADIQMILCLGKQIKSRCSFIEQWRSLVWVRASERTNEWAIARTKSRIMLHMHITYVCMLLSNRTEPNRAQHISDMIVMMGLLSMENDTPMSDRSSNLFAFLPVSMNEKFDEMWIHSLSYFIHKPKHTHDRTYAESLVMHCKHVRNCHTAMHTPCVCARVPIFKSHCE